MLKDKNLGVISDIGREDVPVVEIVDSCGYISQTKIIAKLLIKTLDGKMIRRGKLSRTKRGGYMFE